MDFAEFFRDAYRSALADAGEICPGCFSEEAVIIDYEDTYAGSLQHLRCGCGKERYRFRPNLFLRLTDGQIV